MKCADEYCIRPALPAQDYCSSICAPKGARQALKPTRSVLTVSSFTAGDGAESEESSNESEETKNEQGSTDRDEPRVQSEDTGRSTRNTSPKSDQQTNGSTGETQRKVEPTTMKEKPAQTLPALSAHPSPPSVGEKSESTNFIDDSLSHLHGLMKSVRLNLGADPNARLDPQAINAACNCAKQMSSLLKLKIEVAKAKL